MAVCHADTTPCCENGRRTMAFRSTGCNSWMARSTLNGQRSQGRGLHHRRLNGNAGVMPDRSFRAVDELIRRVQRVAAGRPDATYILAQMISMIGESEVDPYAIPDVLSEGAVHTLTQHIPTERQAETAGMLAQLLEERLKAHGLSGDVR